MGYVKTQGSAGSPVPDTETIYASKACLKIIRAGKAEGGAGGSSGSGGTDITKINNATTQAKKKTKVKLSGLAPTEMTIDAPFVSSAEKEESKDNMTQKLEEASKNGGITQDKTKVEQTQLDQQQQTKLQKLEGATKKLESLGFKGVSSAKLTAWFTMMEDYLDSLPDIMDLAEVVYEVKKEDDKWVYTGESEEMDCLLNQKLNEFKKKLCKRLNVVMEDVTNALQAKLEDLLNRMQNTKVFVMVINLIKKVPSLTDIIDWAKAVIDFFVAGYELIYSMVMAVIQMLEIIIVKFPQLINKIIKVITKFDCPLDQAKPIKVKVNVKKSEGNSTKEGKMSRKTKNQNAMGDDRFA